MTFSPLEIATAYHEAGHAVVAMALGRPVQRVSVQANHLRLGQCEIKKGAGRPAKDAVETEILILLGGLAAEARQTGEYARGAAAQDLRGVRLSDTDPSLQSATGRAIGAALLDKTEHILDQPGVWLAAERIAEELLRVTTISGRAARHLFEQAAAETEG